ncbi:hypothetical protein CC85DRAFT_287462 [Cutaneotrichosporon oleaginosum]|uniref:SIMPL domain-containing protein n=1 Tax=Cutaneotrichosporon oleaginosum TaxID=879819 RepID=A0A0J0XHE7_9TREE|nr:uncharacterized protein CC85DRAFT_287462 [Cutaneotrichosporon oleaginosum]KLT40483.1 hypothetical protein CC85DRAFT_287462 [Cutaneotrichosporon oleaginosum]TXT15327.1 hypothetical protein COLE_01520 [Cutaneotrichosporon oleaginosum]
MSSVTIHAAGSYTVKRTPELVDLHLRIHSEAPSSADALEAVRVASADVSSRIKALAPPKADVSAAIDSEEHDIDDEARDPAYPVTSWSMQQLRTWRVIPDDHLPRPPRPPVRMMMMASAGPEEPPKPQPVFHAETFVRATFHDFGKLSSVIEAVTANDAVSVDNLTWEVTRATRKALQTRVRQGAYADALDKAVDYAAPIAPNSAPRPVEVRDDSISYGRSRVFKAAAPMMMMDGSGSPESTMTFEPEPIEISSQVNVKFVLDI